MFIPTIDRRVNRNFCPPQGVRFRGVVVEVCIPEPSISNTTLFASVDTCPKPTLSNCYLWFPSEKLCSVE